jgi:hypothetical protein
MIVPSKLFDCPANPDDSPCQSRWFVFWGGGGGGGVSPEYETTKSGYETTKPEYETTKPM